MNTYRVWFASGACGLEDAPNPKAARALAMGRDGVRHGDRITRVENLTHAFPQKKEKK